MSIQQEMAIDITGRALLPPLLNFYKTVVRLLVHRFLDGNGS